MKVLLLGGTGTLSFAVMTLALSKGMEITVFNRGNNNSLLPSSVKKLVGNFYDKVSIEDSMRGKTFDVVVDFLSRKPEDIRRVFKIFEDKCIQYIFISSACVYRRDNNDFPLKEYSPKPNINWKYNIEKYESEKTLISLCKQGKCYYTIIRPYITYDDNRIPFGIAPIYKYHRTIIERIRSGKPMFIWEKGDVLTTVTHVADFSKGVVGLFMNTKAFNEDFHITSGYIYKVKDILNIEDEQENNIEEDNEEETERVEDIDLEAKFVAKRIKQLIEDKFIIYDAKKEEKRNIQYKDIVVLLRSTKEAAPIFEKEILNLDIPVFSDSSSEYLESIEIQTIMSLLKVIDNPMQEIPLVATMRSMIGGFTDNELVQIRLSDRYDNFYNTMIKAKKDVDTKLKQKIETFLDKLEMWRKEQEYVSLDEFIWKIYNDTGYYHYVELMTNGELRQANLKMLFERAKQFESISFKGLFNFIRYIDKIKTSSKDMDAAKTIGENDNVVRIMSIHKSKGLEFPVVFLAGTGKQFNMQDLNQKILLHPEIGIGVKYIDYDMQIEYDTLSKQAIRNQMLIETLSEEMRVLYVALTRSKEKLIITGYSKDDKEKQKEIQELKSRYQTLNHILLKKYTSYLDWIRLVCEFNNIEELATIHIYNKNEIMEKMQKQEEIEKLSDKIKEQISEKKPNQEQEKHIIQLLEYEYPYKIATTIPNKISVTEIKQMQEPKISNVEKEKTEMAQVELPIPKFIQSDDEIKITNAEKGTLIHLCMQKLDVLKAEYSYEEIKELIQKLVFQKTITLKEAEAIPINKVYQFTKSNIWKEMTQAKEVQREKPFYIHIPAKEIYQEDVQENLIVQGIIDLYYVTRNNELILVDFKTDYVENGDEQKLVEKYKTQLEMYKKALEISKDKKVDKMYIYSTFLEKEILI